MHTCLRIPELLALICREVSLPGNAQDPAQARPLSSLVALARTCRTFSSTALSILWESQDGLVPLLSCFPPDLLPPESSSHSSTTPGRSVHIRWGLRRAVQPEDWSRVLFYSRFVKDLLLWTTETALGRLEDTAIRELAFSLSQLNIPLFPNLRRLRYRSSSLHSAANPILTHLSGPNLHTILYTVEGPADPVDLTFLRHVAQRSPNVTEFSCSGFADAAPPSQQSLHTLLDVVRCLPRLRRASIPCWAPLVRQLASIESLDALSIQGHASCPILEELDFIENGVHETGMNDSSHSPLVGPSRLRRLRSLSLDFQTGLQLLTFLDNVCCMDSPLETLHMYLTQSPPQPLHSPLLDAIRRSIPMTHMLNISLFARYSTQPQCFAISQLLDVLLPSKNLLSLEALIPEFLVTKRYCLPPGDPFVDKLARGFSQLRELTLAPCTEGDLSLQATSTTLRCLVSLAEFCPNLSFLRMTLDAEAGIPSIRKLLPEGRERTNHRASIQLEVVHPSPLGMASVPAVSAFLVGVFDEISGLDAGETSEWRDAWEAVGDAVHQSQAGAISRMCH